MYYYIFCKTYNNFNEFSYKEILYFQCVESFGQTIEDSLIKYGRGIVDEQFILHRITQAAFDTYTMAVVLSRATRSLNKNIPSAEHEFLMAQTWCAEV